MKCVCIMHACSRKYIDFPLVWWPCNLHFFLLPSFFYCLPSNISILAIKNTGYCYISFLVLLCKYFKEIIYVYRFSSFRSEFQYMFRKHLVSQNRTRTIIINIHFFHFYRKLCIL